MSLEDIRILSEVITEYLDGYRRLLASHSKYPSRSSAISQETYGDKPRDIPEFSREIRNVPGDIRDYPKEEDFGAGPVKAVVRGIKRIKDGDGIEEYGRAIDKKSKKKLEIIPLSDKIQIWKIMNQIAGFS